MRPRPEELSQNCFSSRVEVRKGDKLALGRGRHGRIQRDVVAQVDKFLSKVVNDSGKPALARLGNGFDKSRNLRDPEPLHLRLSKPDQALLATKQEHVA
jgi:hypothetical protein